MFLFQSILVGVLFSVIFSLNAQAVLRSKLIASASALAREKPQSSLQRLLPITGVKSGVLDVEIEPGEDDNFYSDNDERSMDLKTDSTLNLLPWSTDIFSELETQKTDPFTPYDYSTLKNRYSLNGDLSQPMHSSNAFVFREKNARRID